MLHLIGQYKPECLELLQGRRRIWKQEGTSLRMHGHLDATIIDAIIDPVRREIERLGNLRYGQIALDPPRMRVTPLLEDAMLEPYRPHGARQHLLSHRRAITLRTELLRNLLVCYALPALLDNQLLHGLASVKSAKAPTETATLSGVLSP